MATRGLRGFHVLEGEGGVRGFRASWCVLHIRAYRLVCALPAVQPALLGGGVQARMATHGLRGFHVVEGEGGVRGFRALWCVLHIRAYRLVCALPAVQPALLGGGVQARMATHGL